MFPQYIIEMFWNICKQIFFTVATLLVIFFFTVAINYFFFGNIHRYPLHGFFYNRSWLGLVSVSGYGVISSIWYMFFSRMKRHFEWFWAEKKIKQFFCMYNYFWTTTAFLKYWLAFLKYWLVFMNLNKASFWMILSRKKNEIFFYAQLYSPVKKKVVHKN